MQIAKAIKQAQGEATIRGWVYRERGSKKLRFLVVRDADNIIQCVVNRDEVSDKIWSDAESLKVEAAVELSGTLHPDERAPTGVELKVSKLDIIGESVDFPITKDFSAEHLANNRHLWLRSRRMTAIMKVRHTVFKAFREYFDGQGFYEFHSPIFQSTQAEGGSTLFSVKYFDDELFLTQTWQLYAEAGIFGLEKMYTIAPTFRAEKSKTSRHLTEFWMAEMEQAWASFDDIIGHGEAVFKHIVQKVLEVNKAELEILERDVSALRPSAEQDYPRMTYDEVLEFLKGKGMKVSWGKDLRTLEEDELSKHFKTPVIVTHYPTAVKAFYMKRAHDNPKVVLGCDFIAPEGYGEVLGGSERETDLAELEQRLRQEGEDPADYAYYLDTRRYGSVPHGGFGVGMERVVSWLCGLDTIKDAIAFPRTPLRYRP
jgi:asparaginyl-tRNA synthetase